MQLYIKQMPTQGRPLLAGDHTAWSRPNAVTLQERTIEHSIVTVGGNKPITMGQGYSTIAWIPEDSGSWALPVRHVGETFPKGTPARSPKPRGKSPGWKRGQQRQRRIRYPVVKKTTAKPRKQPLKSA